MPESSDLKESYDLVHRCLTLFHADEKDLIYDEIIKFMDQPEILALALFKMVSLYASLSGLLMDDPQREWSSFLMRKEMENV